MTVNNTPFNPPPGLSEVGITNTPGLTGRWDIESRAVAQSPSSAPHGIRQPFKVEIN
jgi:hypothetical protein